ncbi:hypothetical protein AB0K00_33865 [Dactylosporangium sp. NPDC049525]|uniref:hypothetical protein n=1 Tax=Dactylosporangium sp. NPDC049525 TaxID=3154730 RepID=UPI0034219C5D
MGGFIHIAALRCTDSRAVADAVVRYAAGHGVPAEVVPTGAGDRSDVASVGHPDDGWSVVDWPRSFAGPAKATRWLSGELGVVASLAEYYDGDDWNHMAFDCGEVRDRYASDPDGQTSELTTLAEARHRWAGDAAVVAAVFERRTEEIAPYFARPRPLRRVWARLLGAPPHGVKAWPDDQFHLDDPWVFVDFWKRLGINYPDDPANPDHWAFGVRFAAPGSKSLPYDTSTD